MLAFTQSYAQGDVNAAAGDAFGRRIGLESIGLYSESLVRGFDLQQAGNYRIEDAWFARAAPPPDTIVAGSQVRLGPSALTLDFPAPSGVVQYRLLPGDREQARVQLGFQHLMRYLDGELTNFSWLSKSGLAVRPREDGT